jgi:LacI family transcriptional regulator
MSPAIAAHPRPAAGSRLMAVRRKQAVGDDQACCSGRRGLAADGEPRHQQGAERPARDEGARAGVDRALGYVPSIAAQRMSGSRSYLIMALNDRERTIDGWKSRQGTDWVDQMLFGGMLTCAEHSAIA